MKLRRKGAIPALVAAWKINDPTAQVAESHIDSLINAQHKRKRKMQWIRQSVHNVLQIRAKMASQEWNQQWQNTVLEALIGATQKDIA